MFATKPPPAEPKVKPFAGIKAARLRPGENPNPPPDEPPPHIITAPPTPAPTQPAPPAPAEKYKIESGHAPVPNTAPSRHHEAYLNVCQLEPGQWFYWTDAPKKHGNVCRHWRKRLALKFPEATPDIQVYTTEDGRVVVKRFA